MSDRIGWGIMATGRIAGDFTRDLQLIGADVVAVGSREMSRARAFADEHTIANAYGDYESLVADPDVDVVYIATPNVAHAENAILALKAGKHVLVEKPFAVNAAEARAMVDCATERGLVILEAMWTRWMPHMRRIREIVRAGEIGEIRSLVADHCLKLSSDPSHRVQAPALGGGALLDLGVYPVSFAFDLLGEPDRVRAISDPTATGVDASTSILLGFPGQGQAVLHTSLEARGPVRAQIVGLEGWIEIDPFWYFPSSFTRYDASARQVERFEHHVAGRGMQFQAQEMEQLIREGRSVSDVMPPAQSIAIMTTMDEIRRQISLLFPGETIGHDDRHEGSERAVGI